MSYFAGRWARAQTLLLDRDTNALAVLKELADDFRDDLGSCRVNSYRMLALLVGFKKPDTASAAVARLEAKGLVRASAIFSADKRQIVGTRFELVGYVKDEWPEQRQGLRVWVETALAAGALPQRWWPKVDDVTPRAGNACETDDARVTGVPRETGEGTPPNGVRVPRETGEGYPVKRVTNTGDIQGLTGNKHFSVETPLSPAEADDENTQGVLFSEEEKAINAPAEKVPRPKNAFPPCPYQKIVELYHEKLPMFPRVVKLTTSRRTAINARWKDVCEEIRSDGLQVTEATALENFVCFFDLVLRDDFLMGRTPRGERFANWRCTLDYLMTPKGFFKLIEKYR